MAKETINLCPEHNTFASDDQRKITDAQMAAANFERTPVLDPSLIWVCPAQENFATVINILGVGPRVSKRFWFAGFDADGNVKSVRSISVSSLRAMALGFVKEGVDAPVISAATNENGATRTAPGTRYIHAMEDTSWIRGANNLYIVKEPICLKATGSAEVYQAAFKEGQMQKTEDGKVELNTVTMKFFEKVGVPTDEELQKAAAAISMSEGDHFYAL